jgi:hypothetical protein
VPHSPLPVAHRIINYSTANDQVHPIIVQLGVFAHLLDPVNLIVLGVMYLMHICLILLAIVSSYIVLIFVAPIVLAMILVGHYAMLVEDTGPGERDELPRPLRNVHMYDDAIAPFLHMVCSMLLCYWPSVVIIATNLIAWANDAPFPFPQTRDMHTVILLVGSLFFPATLLTLCTSGNLVNLRPDRIWGTIRCTGVRYLLIVLLWMIAVITCLGAHLAVLLNWFGILDVGGGSPPALLGQPFIAYPLLAIGIYLMHAFGWVLGLEYRRSQPRFPWVLQQHERTAETVRHPTRHPKVVAAEQAAQERAAKRAKPQVR